MKNQKTFQEMRRTKQILFIICTILSAFSFTTSAQTDLKIKVKSRIDFPNMPTTMKNPQMGEMMDFGKLPDSTVLIKGARMLTETRPDNKSGQKLIITKLRQCDLGRELSYTNKSKKYTATHFSSNSKMPIKGKPADKESGGTVTFSMTYTDTGERQQIFGYTARHVKSVMTTKPSPDACEKKPIKVETDAWYIDSPTLSCPTFSAPEPPSDDGEQKCNDKIIYQINGKSENGFAVKETMIFTLEGNPAITIIKEVTEITKTDLDAQLFEIPPGYTETKDSGNKNLSNDITKKDGKTETASSQPTVSIPPAPATNTALQAKKSGMIRIGIAKPNVQIPSNKDDTTAPLELSAAVRDSLVESLKAESIEAVRLNSDTPESEAKQMNCDYIFYANVIQKRGGGGKFGKMVALGVISMVGGMAPGASGMVVGTTASVVMQQQVGKITKAKDEFTFEYKVLDLNNTLLSKAITKTKAEKDGEDVLTTQIQQASKTVLGEIGKKKSGGSL